MQILGYSGSNFDSRLSTVFVCVCVVYCVGRDLEMCRLPTQ
jgi:hypothetical protein